jgi:hypothetical protein
MAPRLSGFRRPLPRLMAVAHARRKSIAAGKMPADASSIALSSDSAPPAFP